MKNLDELGVQELSQAEMMEVEGGIGPVAYGVIVLVCNAVCLAYDIWAGNYR